LGEALDVDVLSCCAFWARRKEMKREGKTNGEHVDLEGRNGTERKAEAEETV